MWLTASIRLPCGIGQYAPAGIAARLDVCVVAAVLVVEHRASPKNAGDQD
jgi:uncharacterized membrane protein YhiD involved in acid resistance